MCRPESVPCWSIKEKVQAALPERYYLATERRLGVRLPGDFPVAPLLRTDRDPSFLHTRSKHVHETTMAVITATSWPGRKDYTAERYQVLAQALSRHVGPLRLLIISGRSEQQTARIDGPRHEGELAIWSLSGATATELVPVLAHCELVVGNDTGLTHMAALSRTQDGHGPQVVGLYTRHSHSKWRTGLPWHHAMATDHSHRMHQGDLCPVRDQISDPPEQDMTRFSPALVAEACAQLLAEGTTP
ncbi:glycosyltransferase family 9 protein [Nocardiopsis alba]|uniref:glycosyltransferase family 9 protein n=1 Tax=Nocardiopsis alba TaxID=53437 RepID=UPI00367120E5